MFLSKSPPRFSLLILCLGAFLDWVSYGIVFPFFAALVFQHEFPFLAASSDAIRGLWLGVLVAISPIGQFFASPILGRISDRRGRKSTLKWALGIIVIGYFFSAIGIWVHSFVWLLLGRLVTGIGAGNISVINSAVADLSPAKDRAKNFARVAMASGVGFTLGPLFGGKLSAWGFDIPFIAAGLLTLVTFLLFTLAFSETYLKQREKQGGFNELIRLPSFSRFPLFFSAFFMFCFGWSFYWEFIPVTWIKVYGLNVAKIGNFYAYGSAFYVLGSGLLVKPMMKRFKAEPLLIMAWAILSLCFFLLLNAFVKLYWVYIPIQQLAVSLIFPVGTAVVSNAVKGDEQGEVLGNFQSLQSFAFAMTPLLGGVLLGLSYNIPLIVGGVSMLLAFLMILTNYRRAS